MLKPATIDHVLKEVGTQGIAKLAWLLSTEPAGASSIGSWAAAVGG